MPTRKQSSLPAATCTAFHLRRATRVVQRVYDQHLHPAGLRSTQFSLLNAVSLHGPCRVHELAEQLVMDRTTLSRNLRPLLHQGWLCLQPDEDRRAKIVHLSTAGREVLNQAMPAWRKAQRATEALLGKNELKHLRRQLQKLEQLPQ